MSKTQEILGAYLAQNKPVEETAAKKVKRKGGKFNHGLQGGLPSGDYKPQGKGGKGGGTPSSDLKVRKEYMLEIAMAAISRGMKGNLLLTVEGNESSAEIVDRGGLVLTLSVDYDTQEISTGFYERQPKSGTSAKKSSAVGKGGGKR